MKKVIQEKISTKVFEPVLLSEIDFSDTFSTTNHVNTLEEVAELIFNIMPKWIQVLLSVRNSIVSRLGLKTVEPYISEKNDYKNFFNVSQLDGEKIVLGEDDSHLNFRVVVQKTNTEFYNIKVTTLVQYHHFLGRVYMWFVKPFHKLVVKQMVKQAFRV